MSLQGQVTRPWGSPDEYNTFSHKWKLSMHLHIYYLPVKLIDAYIYVSELSDDKKMLSVQCVKILNKT